MGDTEDFSLTGSEKDTEPLFATEEKHGLRPMTKKMRNDDAKVATSQMRPETVKEKIKTRKLKPLNPLRNLDLITFGVACALTGASVALLYVQHYKTAIAAIIGIIACVPAVLLQFRGDLAKTFRLILTEIVRKILRAHVEKEGLAREFKEQEEGFWLSVYAKVNKLDK